MSQSGSCPKAMAAEYLGYPVEPKPEYVAKAAEEGKWHEERMLKELEEQNWLVSYKQQEFSLTFNDFVLAGHIDGIGIDPDEKEWLIECKSMSQFEFDRWMKEGFKGFPEYAVQLTCYMRATRIKNALYLVKNRNSGYLHKTEISESPVDFEDIAINLTKVAGYILQNKLPEVSYNPNSIECKRCSYKHLCINNSENLEIATELELTEAAEKWRKGNLLTKKGEELIAEAKEVFTSQSLASKVYSWQFARLAISYFNTERKSYDTKVLESSFTLEQLKPALKVSSYSTLKVTDLEKE